MEKITLTNEMLELLSQAKGKMLKSYEYFHDAPENYAFGSVRLNFARYSIDVDNYEEGFSVFGRVEDVPRFTCVKVNRKDPFGAFDPALEKKTRVYLVDERVEGVQVVRDEVRVTRDDGTGEHLLVDQALRVFTPRTVLTFWRDWFYSEVIRIDAGPEPCEIMPVEKVKYDWGDEGEDPTEVTRTIIEL